MVDAEPSVGDAVAVAISPDDPSTFRKHEHPVIKLKNLFVVYVDVRRETLDAGGHGTRLDRIATEEENQSDNGV